MKVLNIIQRYHPAIGGAEFWCRIVCQHLATQGVDVRILTLAVDEEEEYWRDKKPRDSFMSLGRFDYDGQVKVRRYKRSIPNIPFKFLSRHIFDNLFNIYLYGPHSLEMYFDLPKQIQNADIVHLHALPHNIVGFFLSKLCNKPIVITPHFHPDHNFYERGLNYSIMRGSKKILAVSELEKTHLAKNGIPEEKIKVLANGINPNDYIPNNLSSFKKDFFKQHSIKEGTKFVVFIGRKIEYKGISLLVDAINYLKNNHKLKLLLIGPSTAWFEDFYSKLTPNEKDCVIDLGMLPHQEKVSILHMSDILVLPSQYEAFGIVFLEAWICDIPVIGTDKGAIPHVIDSGGLTFKSGDCKDLSGKIKTFLNNPLLAKKMANEGKRKVFDLYNSKVIGNSVFNVYREILN